MVIDSSTMRLKGLRVLSSLTRWVVTDTSAVVAFGRDLAFRFSRLNIEEPMKTFILVEKTLMPVGACSMRPVFECAPHSQSVP